MLLVLVIIFLVIWMRGTIVFRSENETKTAAPILLRPKVGRKTANTNTQAPVEKKDKEFVSYD